MQHQRSNKTVDVTSNSSFTCKQSSINGINVVVLRIDHVLYFQVVDSQNESKDASSETEGGVDIDETLQDELCELWDMSMNSVYLKNKYILPILCTISVVKENSN